MIGRSGFLAALGALVALGAAAPAQNLVEEVEKKIDAAFAEVKSYTARLHTTTHTAMGEEMSYDSTQEGTTEARIAGEKILLRLELTSTTDMKGGGMDSHTEAQILMVCDGEALWALNDDGTTKQVMKQPPQTLASHRPSQALEALHATSTLSRLDDEEVDGHPCYVIEATSGLQEGVQPGRTVMFLRQDCGLTVRSVTYDAGGQVTAETRITDVELNADLDEARFVFEAPEGVPVIDMTGMMGGGAPAGEDE